MSDTGGAHAIGGWDGSHIATAVATNLIWSNIGRTEVETDDTACNLFRGSSGAGNTTVRYIREHLLVSADTT